MRRRTRFGATEIFYPEFKNKPFVRLFIKIVGNVDTGTSHHHFMRTVRHLPLAKMIKILDAGCGRGSYSFWLSQSYPWLLIDACDISETNIAICHAIQQKVNTNCRFFVQDLRNFQQPSMYEFIFSNHVLEHIFDNHLVIAALVSSLKPGGYIYIQIPSATQSRLFPVNSLLTHTEWAKDEHVGQFLTLNELSQFLIQNGCEIILEHHTAGFWGELSFELKEIALNYFHSNLLFLLLFPMLKLFGYIDSILHHRTGNGILILARKSP